VTVGRRPYDGSLEGLQGPMMAGEHRETEPSARDDYQIPNSANIDIKH
jgi:hypothetical protein